MRFRVSFAAATAYSRLGEKEMQEKGLTEPSVNDATTAGFVVDISDTDKNLFLLGNL